MKYRVLSVLLGSTVMNSKTARGAGAVPVSNVPLSVCSSNSIYLPTGACFACSGGMVPDAS